ncbi:sulfotransferase [Pseudomonas sp. J452]|uniref:sulfotransferase family protein n=1 Tax=Pseudomonas sp. J452 TaxID=2898441 RepID=UPI0021AD7FF0|nr:sulfotransferase [Pseudomonas sp. J452]UUY08342.1 sulfotransferase [Pseudomonas sp. J452]
MTQPLFILALPRSYTSLIAGMLGQHPQAFGLPELNLFTVDRLMEMWDGKSDAGFSKFQRHGILRAVAEIYAGEQTSNTVEMANHWLAARQSRSGTEVFQEICQAIAPLMAIEKSPAHVTNSIYLERLYAAYPDAFYMHLTRHPTNQGNSVMKMQEGGYALSVNSIDYTDNQAIIDPQLAWHDTNLNIMELLDKIPDRQKMHVRGEDVMADPLGSLANICRWLGLRDDIEALEDMLHPELSPFACVGPINALFGNDPNFLRDPVFQPHVPKQPPLRAPLPWRMDGAGLKAEVQKMALEFGYQY